MPVRSENDDVWHVIGLSLENTAKHQAQAELEAKIALIEKQQAVIHDLETPIIQVWDRILTLPMVGVVDSRRAARVTDDLLTEVSRTQARFAILDLTGVEVVDTATAGHLLKEKRLAWRAHKACACTKPCVMRNALRNTNTSGIDPRRRSCIGLSRRTGRICAMVPPP